MKTLSLKVDATMKSTIAEVPSDVGIHLSALVPESVPTGDGALEPLVVERRRELCAAAESSTLRDASTKPTTEEVPSDAGDPPSAQVPESAPDGAGAKEPPFATRGRELFVVALWSTNANPPSA